MIHIWYILSDLQMEGTSTRKHKEENPFDKTGTEMQRHKCFMLTCVQQLQSF